MKKRTKTVIKVSSIALLAVILLFAVVIYSSYKRQQSKPFTGDLNTEVNKVRLDKNLPALNQTSELSNIAKLKCDDMIKLGYFDHPDPNGKWVWDKWEFLAPEDYGGENLAKGTYTAQATVNGWVNSPSHYENLVKPQFKEVGYAVCKEDGGLFYKIVQILKS
jgi:uncharacterized protein YkwD